MEPLENTDRHVAGPPSRGSAAPQGSAAVPSLDALPAELKVLRRWLAFTLGPPHKPGGKPTKIPINPRTGRKASTTDPRTWGSFDEACARAAADGLAGIGFVFTKDDPYAGIDLDDCRNAETGEIEPWAREIIAKLDSYTEVSVSGTGVHILVRGKLPAGQRRQDKIEMYDEARYFVVTGRPLPAAPATIEQRSEALAALHAETFTRTKKPKPPLKPARSAADVTDDELLAKARAAKNGDKFDSLTRGDTTGYASSSEADLAYCHHLAFWTAGDAARMDALFRRSGLMRDKWDERRGDRTYGESTIAMALRDKADFYTPEQGDSDTDDTHDTFTKQLVNWALAQGLQPFHDNKDVAYAGVPVKSHVETMRLRERRFKAWLSRGAFQELGRAASAQVLNDVCSTLAALALHDAPEERVFVRIGELNGAIYLDLGDPDWKFVEITASGWKVLDKSPVRFRRSAGCAALPIPVAGGTLAELRPFINCQDLDWPLILGWTAAAYRPTGPYPVLNITGPQGSAKSTIARFLRALIDPNSAPLRTQPGGDRDLMIAASNSWLQTYDNLSRVPPALSDAICRLATGGGYTTRTLYSDDDESIFDAQRPVTLTGIEEVVTREDLLDRSLLIYCPKIDAANRRPEEEIRAEFEASRPRLLGALLSAVSTGLSRKATVKIDRLPRMADFATWAVACETAFGITKGTFLVSYGINMDSGMALALETNAVASAVRDLVLEVGEPLRDTAKKLLAQLDGRRANERPPLGWPQTPKDFSGALRRGVPSLAAIGISVNFTRDTSGARTRWITISPPSDKCVRSVRDRPDDGSGADNGHGSLGPAGRSEEGSASGEPSGADPADQAISAAGRAARTQPDAPDATPGTSADVVRSIFADATEVDAAQQGLDVADEEPPNGS